MSREYRIFGPPGTGKTTTLSRLITEACERYGSEAVIAASFTRTAAHELVGRRLPLDQDQIGTLHALCFRSMGHPKLVGKSLLADWNTAHPLWRFAGTGKVDLDDPYADFDRDAIGEGDTMLAACNRLRGFLIPSTEWPLSMASFYEAWLDFKANTETMDFTDLIERCLHGHEPIPHAARVFFLDEVQDFSPLELALARQWGEDCDELWLAGDDDQSLYQFKGCTPDAFLFPPLPPEQIQILSQSYRVPRTIHAVATDWATSQIITRMPKAYAPRPAEGSVQAIEATCQYLDPLQDLIESWIDRGKTIALLASCSYLLDSLKHALRDWGIPFHNPWRRRRGDWNPLHGRDGTCSAAARVLSFRRVADGGGWWTYDDLWKWSQVLQCRGDHAVLAHGSKTAIFARAEERGTLAVEPADLEQWIPSRDAADRCIAGDLTWFQRHLLESAQKPVAYASAILEQRGQEALTGEPHVILGTIHSVKGGEADAVVLFPDLSPQGMTAWVAGGEAHDAVARMWYVGLTRAREALYLTKPRGPRAIHM